jgi:hypothetical protein
MCLFRNKPIKIKKNMKLLFISLSLFVSLQCVWGQSFESTASILDTATFITEGKIMTKGGNCYSYGVGYTDYFPNLTQPPSPVSGFANVTSTVVCKDLTGNLVYANRYFFGISTFLGGSNYSSKINSLCEYDDRNFAITGNVKNQDAIEEDGEELFSIIDKSTGIPLLAKSINISGSVPGYLNEDAGRKIIYYNNYFYITGSTKLGPSVTNERLFVLKIDPLGSVAWCHTYDVYTNLPQERDTRGNDILIQNNNIYVVGSTIGKTMTSFDPGHYHGFLCEIDLSGNMNRLRTYDYASENSVFNAFVYDSKSKNFTVCGYLDFYIGVTHPFLIQINPGTFNAVWNWVYEPLPMIGPQYNGLKDIVYDDVNNEFNMIGTFNIKTSITDPNDILVLNTDANGNLNYSNLFSYPNDDKGVSIDFVRASKSKPCDATIFYNNSTSFSPNNSFEEFFIKSGTGHYCNSSGVDINPYNVLINEQDHLWNTTGIKTVTDVVYYTDRINYTPWCMQNPLLDNHKNNAADLSNSLRIGVVGETYFQDMNLQMETTQSKPQKLVLFDISGREVLSVYERIEYKVAINMTGLTKGIYLLVIYDNNGLVVGRTKILY